MTSRAGRAVSAARRLAQAETLSGTDDLTSLPNRRSFERALHREVERARRTGSHVAVGLLDIDHFKSFNDRFGHPVGDRVLIQVARRLASAFREIDVVSRWGGEEFAVLLTGLVDGTPAEALAVLERARDAVGGKPVALGPGLPSPMVSVSGGVAVFPEDGGDGPELVRRADAALYEAKRAGRDRVVHSLPA
jgi:two-component system, cell cycle response regulator